MRSFYQEVVDKLKEHHFIYDRPGKGAHEFWKNGSITVMVSFNCYSRHTANGIMKQAGVPHKF